MGDWFGGKEDGLQTYKLYTPTGIGQIRNLDTNKLFKAYIKKIKKTYVVDDLKPYQMASHC